MEKYESLLKFEKYTVNEITFKINHGFKNTDGKIPVDIEIERDTKVLEDTKMDINLKVFLFKSEKREENYPFEMLIDITGFFLVENENPKNLEKNAIAILYPYIRAIVSTYTANANITPLILPAINVNKLIEAQEKKN